MDVADFKNNLKGASLATGTKTAGSNGTATLDLQQTTIRTHGLLSVGAIGGTTPTLIATLEESDDQSTWTPIPGATFDTVAKDAAGSLSLQMLDVSPSKRYLRGSIALAGTNPTFDLNLAVVAPLKYVPSTGDGGAGFSRSPSD